MSRYKITRDGFIPEDKQTLDNATRPDGYTINWLDRTQCPEAYLLNESEVKLVERTRKCMGTVIGKYQEIAPEDYTPEVTLQVAKECIEEFRHKRLSVKKLRDLVDKVQNSQYWTLALTKVDFKPSGFIGYFTVKTSNPDQIPDFEITKKSHPEFFEGDNPTVCARSIGIPDIYYYVAPSDLGILEALKYTFEVTDQFKEKTVPEVDTTPEVFLRVVSTPTLNALHSIGDNIRKVSPENVKRERDKHGKQIELTEYATKLGVKISFTNFNPFSCSRDISVGNPNTDKLLLQAQLECIKTQQPAFTLSLSDFMTFRGLSDRKSALEQAKQACNTLLGARITVDVEDDKKGIIGGVNYVQECYVTKSSNKSGNQIYIHLSDKLYRHIIDRSNEGQQIELLDMRVATIPNNKQTEYNIFRAYSTHLRANVTRGTSHRLSVKTLLGYCSLLPLYPYQDTDLGKPNYLKYRSQAPDKIITPFVNACEWLVNNGYFNSWEFTHTNGKPLTEDELTDVYGDYNLFSSLNIDVEFTNEPDYTHLIENKTKRESKGKKSKK